MNGNIAEIQDLKTFFFLDEGVVRAVDGIGFSVPSGTTMAMVGESGCGKSVTALSIMRLIDKPGKITGGQIIFDGRDILKLEERDMRKIRGNRISMIFQEPMTSLNPVFTVGNQIMEAITLHQRCSKKEARERTIDILRRVGISLAERRVDEYPHQMSGGMRQRVMIAMALVCNPGLLIADEPTTALDVTIQAQILDILRDLQNRLGMSILLITHDLGVVAETAALVCVMYAGRIVEYADVNGLFSSASHPYTIGLLESRPHIEKGHGIRLKAIPGNVPSGLNLPSGCRFHPRCPMAIDDCMHIDPVPKNLSDTHWASCIRL